MAGTQKGSCAPNGAIFEPFVAEPGKRIPIVIAPSLLSSDFANAAAELARCRRARARWMHVDVMDGHFVPNLTLGPPILAKWSAAEPGLFYDAHLMIDNPMEYAEAFVKAGAGSLTVHIETLSRPRRDLRAIKKLGCKVGVSLKPRTPLSDILPFLDDVDMVLVMTVEPGFGGQALIPGTLNKVRELDLARRKRALPFRLQVDGGINAQTAPLAVAAGADVLVAGNAVFNRDATIAENVRKLREVSEKAKE
ncbi:MAG: ribulose-phosphate 3-epimerase [Candidatus Sumerlaeia bacterium]